MGKNLANKKFGLLTALYPLDERASNGEIIWHCLCSCGNETDVRSYRLVKGKKINCGCDTKKHNTKIFTDISDQRFGLLTAISPTKRRSAKSIVWLCKCDCGNTHYASASNLRSQNVSSCGCLVKKHNKKLYEERGIQHLKDGHKYFKNTDIGMLNDKTSSRNTSGIRGVHYAKDKSKWCARITLQGRIIHIGYFDLFEDALKARKEAEDELWKPIIDEYSTKTTLINDAVSLDSTRWNNGSHNKTQTF